MKKQLWKIGLLLALLMALLAMGTIAASENVWYQFEQTIVSEVESVGDKYCFVGGVDPLYKGLDTANNLSGIDRLSRDIKPEFVMTDENGKTYVEGDGWWNGRNSDNGFFVYQYRMAQGATKMQWTATVGGQYGVYVWVGGALPEADTSKWVQLAVYEGEGKDGVCQYLVLEADLTQFEGYETAAYLYIKITDENFAAGVSDAYGGRIALGSNYPITLSYDVDAPAVEYDPNASTDGKLHEIHTFVVGTDSETAYLHANAAYYHTTGIRYADKDKYFIYLHNIENYYKMNSITWSAMVACQLYLQISEDGTTWVDVYKWEGELKEDGSGGLAAAYMSFDLTPYLTGTSSTLYIKISDSYPDGGWGGQVKNTKPVVLDVVYREATEGLIYTLNAAGTEYSVTDYEGTATEVIIPSKYNGLPVTAIGQRAFQSASRMVDIKIPDSVTSIGNNAFYWCSGLTSITIPDSVTNIDYNAFYGCSGLTSITIPDSVMSIGNCAFGGCSGLTSITVAEGNPIYHSAGNCLIETASKTLIAGCKNSVIPADGSVTSIGNNAFYGCSSLTSITIPDSVTSIGYDAFCYCRGLTSITIPASVTSIGAGAFEYCSSLTSITIEGVLEYVGRYAFQNVNTACTIAFAQKEPAPAWDSDWNTNCVATIVWGDKEYVPTYSSEGLLYTKNGSAYTVSDYTVNALYVEIPATYNGLPVTAIGYRAFQSASRMVDIKIPDSVTSIGDAAFYYCENLTSITIPESVTSIGAWVFSGCSDLVYNVYDNAKYLGNASNPYYALIEAASTRITSCDIYPDTKIIAGAAFFSCSSLTSITIPDGVTSIGEWTFSDCGSLTNITVAEGNTAYHTVEKCLIETASNMLITDCNTNVIPGDENVTIIGRGVFFNRNSLTSITIPDGVTSIGGSAFSGCSNLTSITIPNGVESIGGYVFDGCTSLERITFLSPTTAIYNYAETIFSTATIYGYEGSTAQAYAEKYGRTFVALEEQPAYVPGDVDGDGGVDTDDAIYLLYNVIFGDASYPVNQPCDFNGDGVKDTNDAIYLLYHVIFGGTSYPLSH